MITQNLTATDSVQTFDMPNTIKTMMVHNLSEDDAMIFRIDANPTANYKTVPAGESISFERSEDDNKIHYERAAAATADVSFEFSYL